MGAGASALGGAFASTKNYSEKKLQKEADALIKTLPLIKSISEGCMEIAGKGYLFNPAPIPSTEQWLPLSHDEYDMYMQVGIVVVVVVVVVAVVKVVYDDVSCNYCTCVYYIYILYCFVLCIIFSND
jgi:hypothetical protein